MMTLDSFLGDFNIKLTFANMELSSSRMDKTYRENNLIKCLEESIKSVADTFEKLRAYIKKEFNFLESMYYEEKYKLYSEKTPKSEVLSEIRRNIAQMYTLLSDPNVTGANYTLIEYTVFRAIRLYDLFISEYNEIALIIGKELLKPISRINK